MDAGDPAQVKEVKTRKSITRAGEVAGLKALLDTYNGREFIWRVMEKCGIYRSSMTGDNQTFFLEGKRSIGLWVLEEVFTSSPNSYTIMRAEAVDRIKREKGK